MKVIYNPEKTITRMVDKQAYINKFTRNRNFCYVLNLITICITIGRLIGCFVFNQPLTLSSFILNIFLMLCVIVSTLCAKKSVPDYFSITTPDIWYHVMISKYNLLDTKAEKTDNGYSVYLVFDVEGKPQTVHFGVFNAQETSNVSEETLDLENGVVYVPINTNDKKKRSKKDENHD